MARRALSRFGVRCGSRRLGFDVDESRGVDSEMGAVVLLESLEEGWLGKGDFSAGGVVVEEGFEE